MRPAKLQLLVSLALVLGCSRDSPTGLSVDRQIREPSGLTASPDHAGVFWTHGDSGTGNRIFAVDRKGELLASLRVGNTQNIDWEDITHDDQGRLWLGDLGNNDSGRRDLVVHRLPEPDPGGDQDEVDVELSVEFHYPEQTKFGDKYLDFDAEALFWWDGQLWLLTKQRSNDLTRLYRFPSLSGEPVAVEQVASFDLGPGITGARKPWSGQVTAAEAAPDGEHWAMLTYESIYVFELPAPGHGAELFAKPVTRIALDGEYTRQAEALTWDGDTVVVVNEDRELFRIEDPLTRTTYP